MKTFGLKDKTIIVTGAGGFLGGALYNALMCEGANVIGIDINQSHMTDALDISNTKDVKDYVATKLVIRAPIYGLINAAAVSFKGRNIKEIEFDKTMSVNIKGTYNMMEEIKPLMSLDGSIVNIASIYGILSPDFSIYDGNKDLYSSSIYGATKAAIMQISKYYAVQYAPIRVNSVILGGVYNNQSEEFVKKYSKNVPLKRMADANDFTNGVMFLLSNLSSYITGASIPITGGLEIR